MTIHNWNDILDAIAQHIYRMLDEGAKPSTVRDLFKITVNQCIEIHKESKRKEKEIEPKLTRRQKRLKQSKKTWGN